MRLSQFKIATATVVALFAVSSLAQGQERLRLATAPTGSIVHATGSAIASTVTRQTDINVLATPMSGPQVYVPQANNGLTDLILLNAADAANAFEGGTGYNSANHNLRLVSVGFANEIGMLVRDGSGIVTADDLRGKRVAGGYSAHQTCAELSTAMLANLGLSWDDVQMVPVTHSSTGVSALGEGRVDVASCAALGQAVIQEANARAPVRFLRLNDTPEAIEAARVHFPAGNVRTHQAGSNVGVIDDAGMWFYPFYLVAGAHASDEAIYQTVKTIYNHIGDLRGIHGAFNTWIPQDMIDADITLPVHAGAVRFFQENGYWDDAVAQRNAELLSRAQ